MVNKLTQKIDLSQKGGERDFGSHLHPKVYAASATDLSKEEEGHHRLQVSM